MNILKVNRKHHISLSSISKIVIKGNIPWIYLKKGNYPPILKATEGLDLLKKRLVNLGVTIHDFKVEKE
jgi:hypothetical protein